MNTKKSISDQLDIFAMKNMRIEEKLIDLEKNGYEIGHITTLQKEEIVDPEWVKYYYIHNYGSIQNYAY